MTESRHFKINDYVVYPLHGVGRVKEIFVREMRGKEKPFYRIKLKDSDLSISIPVEKASEVGLRGITKKEDLKGIIQTLGETPESIEENWKLRFQQNIEKLKTGRIQNIVVVVKELFIRNHQKALSAMERKQYENAYRMLVKELSLSGETDEEEISSIVSGRLDELLQPRPYNQTRALKT